MTTDPHFQRPPRELHRIGRPPNPFRWHRIPDPLPQRESVVLDGKRWDDPRGDFPTIYAGTDRPTVLAETLATFRAVPGLLERIHAETADDDPDGPDEPDLASEAGVVPADFLSGRALVTAEIDPDAIFIDVDHPATHRLLNEQLGDLLADLGVAAQYDRGVVMTQDRRVTREIARFLYENYAGAAAGLRYESRLAAGLECWALWPTAERLIGSRDLTPLSPEDPEMAEAADLVGVELPALDLIEPREWVDRI